MTYKNNSEYFQEYKIESVSHIMCVFKKYTDFSIDTKKNGVWIFRGLEDSNYELLTSYDFWWKNFEASNNKSTHPISPSVTQSDKRLFEEKLIKKFIRESSVYFHDRPDEKGYLEWASIMQHYGAPSRLLDFSYSFLVSLFFAVNSQTKDLSAVYAINTNHLRSIVPETFKNGMLKRKDVDNFDNRANIDTQIRATNKLFTIHGEPIDLVYPVNPFYLNERLIIQQGLFLIQGNIEKNFHENLKSLVPYQDANVVKYVIPYEIRAEILRYLQRMNITATTLFPGKVGYSQSFKNFDALFPMLMR